MQSFICVFFVMMSPNSSVSLRFSVKGPLPVYDFFFLPYVFIDYIVVIHSAGALSRKPV